MATISSDKYQWLKTFLCVLAIPTGLLLMWAGRQWFLFVTGNVRNLPDSGGHGFEFFVIDLLGIVAFILGCAIIVASIYTLNVTACFKRPISGLYPRDRVIVVFVIIAGIGFTAVAVATGVFVLFRFLASLLL